MPSKKKLRAEVEGETKAYSVGNDGQQSGQTACIDLSRQPKNMVDYNDITHPLLFEGNEFQRWDVKPHALAHKYSRILGAKHFISGKTDRVCVALTQDESAAEQSGKATEGLQSLLDAAVPSSFGRGSDDVFDEAVRKGKEVKADRLDVKFAPRRYSHTNTPLNISETDMQTSVAEWLRVPTDCVLLKCSKLALYEVGGHFSTHRDTNRGPEHVATLLVSVPSEYEGGEFVLTLPTGEEEVWAPAGKPEYFAFHSDLEHVVRPVTKGLRASLQYDVYTKASDKDDYSQYVGGVGGMHPEELFYTPKDLVKSVDLHGHADAGVDAFVAALSEHVTDAKGVVLPLLHLYTKTSIRPRFLKSVDRVLFDRILKAGYTVALEPVKCDVTYSFDPTEVSATVGCVAPIARCYAAAADGSVMELAPSESAMRKIDDAEYVLTSGLNTKLLRDTPYAEHTGNEAAEGHLVYFSGVMVVLRSDAEKAV